MLAAISADRADRTDRVPPRRPSRRVRINVIAVCAVGLLLIAGATRLYIFPAQDPIEASDAIVVVGPPNEWRVQWAERLVAEGYSDTIVIPLSGGRWPDPTICDDGLDDATVICYLPDPFTTAGEGLMVDLLIQRYGWSSVTAITRNTHVERTRFVYERCIGADATVRVVGRTDEMTQERRIREVVYQSGAWLKALFTRC